MEKLKKTSKYILNILTIINALIIGIAPIWNINADKVTNTIAVVIAVISTYFQIYPPAVFLLFLQQLHIAEL